jgi:AAA domain-containing protein
VTTRLWDSQAFAEHVFLAPPYTIAPFLPAGGVAVLHGPPAVGKTQLALTIAAAVSRGEPFLRDFPTATGRVVYIELDIVETLLHERVCRAKIAHPNLRYLTLESGILNSLELHPFNDPGLNETVRFQPDLIIIDTLRDAHLLDENESTAFITILAHWRRVFPKATLLFIHHDRKIIVVNGAVPEQYWNESARGSSAMRGKIDVGLHLTTIKQRLLLGFSKTRTCEDLPPIPVRLNPDTLLVEPTEPNSRQKLLVWVAEHPGADRSQAAKWLMERGMGRSRAHELANEVVGIDPSLIR